jgi:hypothetical protein
MGVVSGFKAVGSAFTTLLVTGASAGTHTFKAIENAAKAGEKATAWLDAQAGKMLSELAAEVAAERGWPSSSPQELEAALRVLQSFGSAMSEADKLFLAQYSMAKIAPTSAPTPAPTVAPAPVYNAGQGTNPLDFL